ncbi:MAG: AAA family ATPase [Muribaculaceae bacterium]|nr:AAA family ATPase [Muribaculaceae bacterium]
MDQTAHRYDYDYLETDIAEEPASSYQLNKELNLAHRIIEETGKNLFLTGKAGTGKTTFLRRLRETTKKRMIVLAPTGVAAINAQGSTIHSFFQLSFSPFIPGQGFIGEDKKRFSMSKEKRRIIASIDLLVIDEISMVRPDTLDAIDSVMRRYRNPVLPFGGVQLLLIGDLRQLAPVLRDDERKLLTPHYPSEYFFDSIALRQSGFETIELTTVYRQNDPDFIDILNAVRDGLVTKDIIDKLNTRYLPGFNPPDSEKYIRLTTHNRMADDFNFRRLSILPTESLTYQAKIEGKFPESSFPADQFLQLKVGAQVMFIKNDSGAERLYYNGMIGEITWIGEDTVTVAPADGSDPICVGYAEWENTRYSVNEESKEIEAVTEGVFRQLPLRLAWAITIHKSQGLTFDRAIIDAGYSFAPGQTYVALSRCRSLEGMVLSQPIPLSAVITDQKVNSFISECSQKRPDEESLNRMRAEYTRHTLAELFDFRSERIAFDDYHRAIREFVVPLYPQYDKPFREAADIIHHNVDIVGSKFKTLYASSPILPEALECHPEFLQKIRKGCEYFLSLLEKIIETVDGVNVNIENKTYVKRLTNAYENSLFKLNIKFHLLRYLANVDFTPAEYVNAKAKGVIEASAKGNSSKKSKYVEDSSPKDKKSKNKNKETKLKRPVGYSRRISYEMFLKGKTIPEIAEERNLSPNTIGQHLGEFVASGELDILDVLEPDKFNAIHKIMVNVGSFREGKEDLQGIAEQYEISVYFNGVYKKEGKESS